MSEDLEVTQPEEQKDPNCYYFADKLVVHGGPTGDKTLDRLRINPAGILKGKDFFQLCSQFDRKFPNDSHNDFNRYASPNFLALLIAKLNGVTPEDVMSLPFEELPLLFISAAPFMYSGPAKKTE
jgi:hypothetical protein